MYFFRFVANNKMKIFISFFISVFLLYAGYIGNNIPLFTGESLVTHMIVETLKNWLGYYNESNTSFDKDVIYINTSFDKELIDYYQIPDVPDAHPNLMGNTEITDRAKLVRLLELLKDVDYKYLIIDIKFAKGLESGSYIIDSITGEKVKVDDKLFSLIDQLDRVVVATHHGIKLIDNGLEKKAALADYRITATATNFVRYEYFDSIPYIPTTIYNDLRKCNHMDTLVCHFPLGTNPPLCKLFAYYTQGNQLCYNSLFLDFEIWDDNPIISKHGELKFLNLSKDILEEDFPHNMVKEYCEGRYVFVGNILQDKHDTYAGLQPGCVILYKALKALNNQKHVISLVDFFVFFILYFAISLFFLKGMNLLDLTKRFRKIDNPFLHFIIDCSTFTVVFVLYHVISYMFGKPSFSFVIPIITLTSLKTFLILKNKYKMKKTLLILFLALLSGFLMSFTQDDGERTIKIRDYSSNRIKVDSVPVKPGMMISTTSKLTLPDPNDWITFINTGKDITINCKVHNTTEIWKQGIKRGITNPHKTKFSDPFWWITYHETSTKGKEGMKDVEYVIGEERPFEIEDTIKKENRDRQYYVFEVTEGKYKGKSFIADPDDTEPVIWISRDILNNSGIILNDKLDSESLLFKVIYHNFDNITTIKDSLKIIFIK